MYANAAHNGAGESVVAQTANKQAAQLGDVSAVPTLTVKARSKKTVLCMTQLGSLIFITVQFALLQRGAV